MKCSDCQWFYNTRAGEVVCAEPPVGLDDEPCGEFAPVEPEYDSTLDMEVESDLMGEVT